MYLNLYVCAGISRVEVPLCGRGPTRRVLYSVCVDIGIHVIRSPLGQQQNSIHSPIISRVKYLFIVYQLILSITNWKKIYYHDCHKRILCTSSWYIVLVCARWFCLAHCIISVGWVSNPVYTLCTVLAAAVYRFGYRCGLMFEGRSTVLSLVELLNCLVSVVMYKGLSTGAQFEILYSVRVG